MEKNVDLKNYCTEVWSFLRDGVNSVSRIAIRY